jgi:hypothetical protein
MLKKINQHNLDWLRIGIAIFPVLLILSWVGWQAIGTLGLCLVPIASLAFPLWFMVILPR